MYNPGTRCTGQQCWPQIDALQRSGVRTCFRFAVANAMLDACMLPAPSSPLQLTTSLTLLVALCRTCQSWLASSSLCWRQQWWWCSRPPLSKLQVVVQRTSNATVCAGAVTKTSMTSLGSYGMSVADSDPLHCSVAKTDAPLHHSGQQWLAAVQPVYS